MDRLGHKLLALAVIFGSIFTSTSLPIWVSSWFERRGRRGRAMLSTVMCFGGGVFLGTFLLHMTPEVDELVSKRIGSDVNYPIAYLVIGAGFFFMMLLERGMLEQQKWWDRRSQNTAPGNQASNNLYLIFYRQWLDLCLQSLFVVLRHSNTISVISWL